GVAVKNLKTGEKGSVSCDGVFIFVGWEPNTDFLKGIIRLDQKGAVMVDKEMRTGTDGLFAAGDCCAKKLHQVVTACGDGATAAFSAMKYIEEMNGTVYEARPN
ncbi:MAG: FAD-dependent oxidoreductase, partial [Candidatus Omnitrophica bacterium]|nr:FAD-dependent oxidoreductase [Candidatus Omnitrophota bacterium]